MEFWIKFADAEIPKRFHFKLPPVYVESLIVRELESIPVRQCAPVRQQEIVTHVLLRGARGYKALLARAVERGDEQFPNGGIPKAQFRRMVTEAVYDAVQNCEAALYWPPLGRDLFTDVVWPEAKRLLVTRHDWMVGIDTDDSERHRQWLKEGDY